ncbi:hypothetical protein [Streptomyces aidingensis]|uniref:Uncharacterized protein n=1 Tax=Streptomyces aidingensis TaxID=910347 RepID=A0A1I1NMW9_9ACTN|nr:hypothetical protein [Streptomyces aidingensis]SFC98632.1 hypothetical protein SAMN05421773_10870 [Streptomyces aidingensis]
MFDHYRLHQHRAEQLHREAAESRRAGEARRAARRRRRGEDAAEDGPPTRQRTGDYTRAA